MARRLFSVGWFRRGAGSAAPHALSKKPCIALKSHLMYFPCMLGSPSTVLIADDNRFTRAALRTFVETKTEFRVCGEAANGIEALEIATQCKPDVVLMDLLMPVANGIESASAIRSALPKTRIVIVTMFPELVGTSMTKMAGIDLVVDKTKCASGLLAAFTLFSNVPEPPAIAPPASA